MRKTYRFIPPFHNHSFTKRFSSDDAALEYAARAEDSAAQYSISKPQEGFWNIKYQCFMPIECVAPVADIEQKLQAEIDRLKALLFEQLRRNEEIREP